MSSKSEDSKKGGSPTKRSKSSESKSETQKMSERDIFNYEVKQVGNLTHEFILKRLLNVSGDVRSSLLELNKPGIKSEMLANEKLNSLLGVAALRKFNRLNHLKCAQTKEETAERKVRIDGYHLKLQNMLYEIGHLQKEIDSCLQFRSKDEDLDLVDVDEFYKSAPETITRPEITRADEHEQRKSRLQFELTQRKSLSEELGKTRENINSVQTEIQERERKLESLTPLLTKTLEATRPVQQCLGINFSSQREQYKLAENLSTPLFVLYRNLDALQPNTAGISVNVSIEGDADEAKKLKNRTVEQEEDSDSDQEGEDKKSERRRRATHSESSEIITQHPLGVKLVLELKTPSVRITLNFINLTNLNIITVKSQLDENITAESVCAGDLLTARSVLSNIYENDRGNNLPTMNSENILEKLGHSDLRQFDVGLPFLWAQRISGLNCLTDQTDQSESSELLIRRIKSSLTDRINLLQLLVELEKCNVIPPTSVSSLFPPRPPKTRLTKWTRATFEDFAVPRKDSPLIKTGVISHDYNLFSAQVISYKLRCEVFVMLSQNYPTESAIFSLTIQPESASKLNSTNSDQIRSIEQCVNDLSCQLLHRRERAQLLTLQIIRLLWSIEVFQTIRLKNTSDEGHISVNLLPNNYRGRDRKLPLTYNPDTGYFTH